MGRSDEDSFPAGQNEIIKGRINETLPGVNCLVLLFSPARPERWMLSQQLVPVK
jgi:hypothetical protein